MDALISLYEQYCEQVRHHQDERRTIANTLLVVIGALVAVAAIDQKIDSNDRLLAIALLVVGLFGSACMVKCHGLIRFYKDAAKNVVAQMEVLQTGVPLLIHEETAKRSQPSFWQAIDKVRLWQMWLVLFLLVSVAGIYLVYVS